VTSMTVVHMTSGGPVLAQRSPVYRECYNVLGSCCLLLCVFVIK